MKAEYDLTGNLLPAGASVPLSETPVYFLGKNLVKNGVMNKLFPTLVLMEARERMRIAGIFLGLTLTVTAAAYLPLGSAITVDMKRLAGPATARWFDPTSGQFEQIEGSPFTNEGLR